MSDTRAMPPGMTVRLDTAEGRTALIERYGGTSATYIGKNRADETTAITFATDNGKRRMSVEVYQSSGWLQTTTYDESGRATSSSHDKRWREDIPKKQESRRQRLYVDMDGTLAVFTPVDCLETLYEKGYFRNLEPHQNVVAAIKLIIAKHPEIEVHILSAYLSDSAYALDEKNDWLDRYIPEIDNAHRVFVPCGSDKKAGIKGGVRADDYLLDDYTRNLNDWQPPARGIKLLNAINHTRGTWKHDRIRYDREPRELAKAIVSVMLGERQIYDGKAVVAPRTKRGFER